MKTNFKTQPAIETPVGRVFAPNTISQKDGYYLSYNTRDWDTYGDATTAIVVETRTGGNEFYILLGDHRVELDAMPTLRECMKYFMNHPEEHSKYSDDPCKEIKVGPDGKLTKVVRENPYI